MLEKRVFYSKKDYLISSYYDKILLIVGGIYHEFRFEGKNESSQTK